MCGIKTVQIQGPVMSITTPWFKPSTTISLTHLTKKLCCCESGQFVEFISIFTQAFKLWLWRVPWILILSFLVGWKLTVAWVGSIFWGIDCYDSTAAHQYFKPVLFTAFRLLASQVFMGKTIKCQAQLVMLSGEVMRLAPVSKMVFFLLNTSNRSLNQGVANVCGLGGSLSKQTCS